MIYPLIHAFWVDACLLKWWLRPPATHEAANCGFFKLLDQTVLMYGTVRERCFSQDSKFLESWWPMKFYNKKKRNKSLLKNVHHKLPFISIFLSEDFRPISAIDPMPGRPLFSFFWCWWRWRDSSTSWMASRTSCLSSLDDANWSSTSSMIHINQSLIQINQSMIHIN